MCGIAGIYDPSGRLSPAVRREACAAMTARLVHRGPDDDGLWADDAAGIALGFRRLAILDLTAAGAQPMRSAGGQITAVFNGEIYNHAALREGLQVSWRGHSDTEALVEAIAAHGLAATLPRLDAMFALAVWDAEARRLHLARDRLGEKPLYWTLNGGVLAFASELKAFAALPWLRREPDLAALSLYLRLGYVPAPHSAYLGIRKLPPAHVLGFGPDLAADEPTPFWDARRAAETATPFAGSAAEAEERLDCLLRAAAASRREADVPVGVLLSGGIDSSTVAAALTASGGPPRSFSIAFPGTRYDEAPHAAKVAAHLGTTHVEIPVTEAEAAAAVPEIAGIWDEPFADPSAIPTLLLCRHVREHVTVALGGDGGDELFAGYARHAAAMRRTAPRRHGLRHVAPVLGRLLPQSSYRARRLARRLDALAMPPDAAGHHRGLVSQWHPTDGLEPATPPLTLFEQPAHRPHGLSPLRAALWLDAATYLPDDLLVKVDRASMSASLEARSPFLANDVVAFAWSLPEEMLLGPDGRGKLLLRRVLHRHVPAAIVDRPKQGFEPPLAAWLRSPPTRDWAAALLEPARLARSGLLGNASLITACWRDHLAGRRNHAYRLWTVLMLMAWAEREGWV
jgi:asparagine synthase (glutamine-hydrolysing)